MKSIAYAESKLGAKMGTPTRVATSKNQPVKYDVEDVAQVKSEQLGSMASEAGQDLGDCDIKDEECIAQQHKVLAEAAKVNDPKKKAVKVEAVQANSTSKAKPAAVAPKPDTTPEKKEAKPETKPEAKSEEPKPVEVKKEEPKPVEVKKEEPKIEMITKTESDKLIKDAHDKGVTEGLSQGLT